MENLECYKTSNNKHFGCPPRMSDGRHFTDYRPNCHINNIIRSGNNIMNSFQYRTFLTRNANELMDVNRGYACMKNCCGPCKEPYHSINTLPEVNKVKCNANNCELVGFDPNGLGQGRIYTDNEKCDNVGQSNVNMNGCAKPEDNLRYYGSQDNRNNVKRNSIPGGGDVLTGGDPNVNN